MRHRPPSAMRRSSPSTIVCPHSMSVLSVERSGTAVPQSCSPRVCRASGFISPRAMHMLNTWTKWERNSRSVRAESVISRLAAICRSLLSRHCWSACSKRGVNEAASRAVFWEKRRLAGGFLSTWSTAAFRARSLAWSVFGNLR